MPPPRCAAARRTAVGRGDAVLRMTPLPAMRMRAARTTTACRSSCTPPSTPRSSSRAWPVLVPALVPPRPSSPRPRPSSPRPRPSPPRPSSRVPSPLLVPPHLVPPRASSSLWLRAIAHLCSEPAMAARCGMTRVLWVPLATAGRRRARTEPDRAVVQVPSPLDSLDSLDSSTPTIGS